MLRTLCKAIDLFYRHTVYQVSLHVSRSNFPFSPFSISVYLFLYRSLSLSFSFFVSSFVVLVFFLSIRHVGKVLAPCLTSCALARTIFLLSPPRSASAPLSLPFSKDVTLTSSRFPSLVRFYTFYRLSICPFLSFHGCLPWEDLRERAKSPRDREGSFLFFLNLGAKRNLLPKSKRRSSLP